MTADHAGRVVAYELTGANPAFLRVHFARDYLEAGFGAVLTARRISGREILHADSLLGASLVWFTDDRVYLVYGDPDTAEALMARVISEIDA